MTETKDWKIDTSILNPYQQSSWANDYFSETIGEKYGVYIYNIDEWRMMSYAGLIAIYTSKACSELLINSGVIWVWYDSEKTFDYAPLSDCLIFRMPAFKDGSKRADFPFLLIKPREKIFAFIEWDSTSIYYGFDEIQKEKLIVKEVHPEDLFNANIIKRTGEMIDITNLVWFDIKNFDGALGIYHGEAEKLRGEIILSKNWWERFFDYLSQ
jgi:hypothetical protein